jgi:hypothetical protein
MYHKNNIFYDFQLVQVKVVCLVVNVFQMLGIIYHFYTPVIDGTYYGMAWIVRVSVCVSVCLSVHFLFVRAITFEPLNII